MENRLRNCKKGGRRNDGKKAFFNLLLYIKDLRKPEEYIVIRFNRWTRTGIEKIKLENIGFVANLDRDQPLELVISNEYYEYRDYAVVDLESP